jgi:hypothetical protein
MKEMQFKTTLLCGTALACVLHCCATFCAAEDLRHPYEPCTNSGKGMVSKWQRNDNGSGSGSGSKSYMHMHISRIWILAVAVAVAVAVKVTVKWQYVAVCGSMCPNVFLC